MSKIISIATVVPPHRHEQHRILGFMQTVYASDEAERRKLRFLYRQSAIDYRHSVIPDYSLDAADWTFYPATENLEPFPGLEMRMEWFNTHAPGLSVQAVEQCMNGHITPAQLTHLITVSCTGISAPGLDLMIAEQMGLRPDIYRTSVNFMGCYAAIHALKLADAVVRSEPGAKVMIVCTELCTLHFQKAATADNIASSLLFADGVAAVLVTDDAAPQPGLRLRNFYSEVAFRGKKDMSWNVASSGFLMTLSGYVPDLVEEDFDKLVNNALRSAGLTKSQVTNWCIHPGGKAILEAIARSLQLDNTAFANSYDVLRDYGNMSSATVLFVLQRIMQQLPASSNPDATIFGAAFGPGLTMETFIASY